MNDLYVTEDDHGVLRVGNSHVMLDSVVAAFLEGHSAEAIQSLYPTLDLTYVYGAIAHYLGHREQIDAYMNQQDATWHKWREQAERDPAPVVRRLRMAHKSRNAETA